jgi:hypothetical protein
MTAGTDMTPVNSQSFFKNLMATKIESQKIKSLKQQKLVNTSSIAKSDFIVFILLLHYLTIPIVTEQGCCKAQCVYLFSQLQIAECRQMVSSLSESQKTEWLMKFMATNMNAKDLSVSFLVKGILVCQLAFCRVYGVAVQKVIQCKHLHLNGVTATIHGNYFRVYDAPKRDSVAAWIQNYCDTYGDYVPTKDEIHLPSPLRMC